MSDQGADLTNYKDLAACDPDEVTQRTSTQYEPDSKQYTATIWGDPLVVDLKQNQVHLKGEDNRATGALFDLFVLYFLMSSKEIPPSGQWVSEKDIPGGAGFFRGPHTIPGNVLTEKFQNDLEHFSKVCQSIGGTELDMADQAFVFQVTQNIPVAVLYWIGDEDFPSEAKLLFDHTIQEHLPLDIIFCLAVEVCYRLAGKARVGV